MKDDRITIAPDYLDDRGELDLTKQIDELHATIAGFQHLVSVQKLEIAHLKKIQSENESNKNLLQGYRKVIVDLSNKLRREDS